MAGLETAFKLKGEMTLALKGNVLPEIRKEVKRRLSMGARTIAKKARELSPYDPHSRAASGRTKKNWPRIHHRQSIKVKAGSVKNLAFTVRTTSNRFYFIEFPTRSGGRRSWATRKFGHRKRGHGATKRVGAGVNMRTPGQPHFWPAVAMNYQSIYDSLEGII